MRRDAPRLGARAGAESEAVARRGGGLRRGGGQRGGRRGGRRGACGRGRGCSSGGGARRVGGGEGRGHLGGSRRRRPFLVVRSPIGRPRRCLRPDRRARLAAGAGRPLRAAREPRSGKAVFLSPNRRSRGHAHRRIRPRSAASSCIPSYARGAIEQLHNAAPPAPRLASPPRRLERTAAALAAATRCSAQSHALLTALQRLPAARGARQCACDSRRPTGWRLLS